MCLVPQSFTRLAARARGGTEDGRVWCWWRRAGERSTKRDERLAEGGPGQRVGRVRGGGRLGLIYDICERF